MRRILLLGLLALAPGIHAKNNEIGLTLGRVVPAARSGEAGSLDLGAGAACQANYGRRLFGGDTAALFGEVHFLASPLREITTGIPTASRDFASLYLTLGVKVKFVPNARVSPWVSVGAGYALYEQSERRTDGEPNDAPRLIHRAAVVFGGGVDVKVFDWLAIRGEERDFYTGNPAFNTIVRSSGQHNVVAGGGFVLCF